MPEVSFVQELVKTSPAIAAVCLLGVLLYRVCMRALDALEANTKALTRLQDMIQLDRRQETRP